MDKRVFAVRPEGKIMANVDRIVRVQELIMQEVASIIQKEIRDPRLGIVTVLRSEVARDLSHAKIMLSISGNENDVIQSLTILNKAAGFIRGRISQLIILKKIPKLRFEIDKEYQRQLRIQDLLKTIETDDELEE